MRLAVATLLASLAHADPGAERFSAGTSIGSPKGYFWSDDYLDAETGYGFEAHIRLFESRSVMLSVGGRAIRVNLRERWERARQFNGHLALRVFLVRDRCRSVFLELDAGGGVVTLLGNRLSGTPDDNAKGVDVGARGGAMFYVANELSVGGVVGISGGLHLHEIYDITDNVNPMWIYAGLIVGIGR